jgi:nucleotide-binding universal stress UspA family protein
VFGDEPISHDRRVPARRRQQRGVFGAERRTVILICYDGSPDSQTAIDQAGKLLGAKPATVLTVWVPFIEVIARTGAGLGFAPGFDDTDIDAASETNAKTRAGEGAERARSAGLDAQSRTRAQTTTVAEAIIAEAAEIEASAIVIGTRGLTGLKSVLLGSVSHAVLQHADLPVIVAPSAEIAAARRARRS